MNRPLKNTVCLSLKNIYKLNFLHSFFIIFLLFIIFIYYSYHAYIDFLHFNAANPRHEYVSLSIERFKTLFRERINRDYVNLVAKPYSKSKLSDFQLFIDKKDIQKLNSSLPESGKEFVTAFLIPPNKINNPLFKTQIRYRGTLPHNWIYKQKSLRVKLAKGNLFSMERKFNLLNPPHNYFIIDYINYDISREMGLLTPDSYPSRVFINHEFMGIYSYLSQVDESLLRKNKRMPGSIYFGESPEVNSDGIGALWTDSELWHKKASRNSESSYNREDINTFINFISNYEPLEFYKKFNIYADKTKFYKFFALDTRIGGSHHDFTHNHKLFFDPYLGKFEPIQWDIRFWDNSFYKDLVVPPLLLNIALNPILEMERDQVAYQVLQTYSAENISHRLNYYESSIYSDLATDKYRDSARENYLFPDMHATFFSMDEFKDAIKHKNMQQKIREKRLYQIYNDTKIEYQINPISKQTAMISFAVDGNSPVDINLADFIINSKIDYSVYKDSNSNLYADKEELTKLIRHTLYPGRKILQGSPQGISSKMNHGNHKLIAAPLYYSFIIQSTNKALIFSTQPIVGTNKITHKTVPIIKSNFKITNHNDSIHPWKLPKPKHERIMTLEGVIDVNNDLIFDSKTQVIIKPGTIFNIYPNKSVYFFAKVIANGVEKFPIIFKEKFKNKPWGSLVLQGEKSSGSQFSHIKVTNGSVAKNNLIDYPGQLNIHDVKNFSLSNCDISNNNQGDDSLHIAYSTGKITSCRFSQSHLDAVDIDISDVSIDNSLFINSGNDAVDLMTSKVKISNSVFLNAKDKCISTGEWSQAVFKQNFFFHCHIGVEVKDKSEVTLSNNIIMDSSKSAINLYNKNYHYDMGGIISGNNLYLIGNKQIISDKKSKSSLMIKNFTEINTEDYQFIEENLGINIQIMKLDSKQLRVKINNYLDKYKNSGIL
jgi:hypothetical protein